MRMQRPMTVVRFILAAAICASGANAALAERPAADQLLPASTLALVHVADAPDLVEQLKASSFGRMLQDPQLQPLVKHLFGSATEAFREVEGQVGLPLPKLLTVPQGEIAVALVDLGEGPPQLVALLDSGKNVESARILLATATDALGREGLTKQVETVAGVKMAVYGIDNDWFGQLIFFEKEGTVVVATHRQTVVDLLARWDHASEQDKTDKPKSAATKKEKGANDSARTLRDNAKFTSIMRRCRVSKETPPQMTFFVDPIALATAATRDSFQARIALAILPAIGLDGVKAAGGSVTVGPEGFDAVSHLHVLLDEERSGVLEMLALEPGETRPQRWVPADAATYYTVNWDLLATYQALEKVVDSYQQPGALASQIERRIDQPTGIKFHEDVLPYLAGRITYLSRFERPVRLNSESRMLAVELTDPAKFKKTLEKLAEKFPDGTETERLGKTTYYRFPSPRLPQPREDRPRLELAPPTPCLGIVDDVLILTDRESFLKKAIAAESGTEKRLADLLEYELIASKIQRLAGRARPAMISFQRPEEGFRMIYDLATAQQTRDTLRQRSDSNRFFKALDRGLEENPLPPFSVLAKYLAPGGGILTNDASGIHYTSFTLRRK